MRTRLMRTRLMRMRLIRMRLMNDDSEELDLSSSLSPHLSLRAKPLVAEPTHRAHLLVSLPRPRVSLCQGIVIVAAAESAAESAEMNPSKNRIRVRIESK